MPCQISSMIGRRRNNRSTRITISSSPQGAKTNSSAGISSSSFVCCASGIGTMQSTGWSRPAVTCAKDCTAARSIRLDTKSRASGGGDGGTGPIRDRSARVVACPTPRRYRSIIRNSSGLVPASISRRPRPAAGRVGLLSITWWFSRDVVCSRAGGVALRRRRFGTASRSAQESASTALISKQQANYRTSKKTHFETTFCRLPTRSWQACLKTPETAFASQACLSGVSTPSDLSQRFDLSRRDPARPAPAGSPSGALPVADRRGQGPICNPGNVPSSRSVKF